MRQRWRFFIQIIHCSIIQHLGNKTFLQYRQQKEHKTFVYKKKIYGFVTTYGTDQIFTSGSFMAGLHKDTVPAHQRAEVTNRVLRRLNLRKRGIQGQEVRKEGSRGAT